jgi:hypothetical protein
VTRGDCEGLRSTCEARVRQTEAGSRGVRGSKTASSWEAIHVEARAQCSELSRHVAASWPAASAPTAAAKRTTKHSSSPAARDPHFSLALCS